MLVPLVITGCLLSFCLRWKRKKKWEARQTQLLHRLWMGKKLIFAIEWMLMCFASINVIFLKIRITYTLTLEYLLRDEKQQNIIANSIYTISKTWYSSILYFYLFYLRKLTFFYSLTDTFSVLWSFIKLSNFNRNKNKEIDRSISC